MRLNFLRKSLLAFVISIFSSNYINAQTIGLLAHDSGGDDDGYVLFAPVDGSDTTYLIDKCGRLVHTWKSNYSPGLDVYLLPDGTLLRSGNVANAVFDVSGVSSGGIIQRFDWNSNLLWQYVISTPTETQNHDVCYLSNGNILVAIWEVIPDSVAIANGRNPARLATSLWSAKIVELQPVGTDSANIVWQWRVWDHLIQDYDSTKPNYGVVADHPELLNLNFINTNDHIADSADWLHLNAVTYNPTFDQVMISFRNLNEIYIIDHSTDSVTAAGHNGGTYNKGGDFLYRWGNPMAYDRGTIVDTKFWGQHDPTWITTGKYTNQIMVFNNGYGRSTGNASSVDIIAPPVDSAGNYSVDSGAAYGPLGLSWTYNPFHEITFFSTFMGSAQPLPNGNTLVCQAMDGYFFELDTASNIVWKYVNPVNNGSRMVQGSTILDANSVYRCTFYPTSYLGFTGETLVAGEPIELNPLPSSCSTTGTQSLVKTSSAIKIYPNPASSTVNVNIEQGNIMQLALTDVTGRTMMSATYNNATSCDLDISSLPDGVYIICINGGQYQKIVVQH